MNCSSTDLEDHRGRRSGRDAGQQDCSSSRPPTAIVAYPVTEFIRLVAARPRALKNSLHFKVFGRYAQRALYRSKRVS